LSSSRTGHSQKTLAGTIARGLIIFKSFSRDDLQFNNLNGTPEANVRRDRPIRDLFN